MRSPRVLPVSEKDPNLVLYVGRLVPYKGCDYLLRAMQAVQQRRPEARLVVIGDGLFALAGAVESRARRWSDVSWASSRSKRFARGWNGHAYFAPPASPSKTV